MQLREIVLYSVLYAGQLAYLTFQNQVGLSLLYMELLSDYVELYVNGNNSSVNMNLGG
jgi:hypothetical protein